MSGHVQDLLSAYLDGELSPPERGMVEAHLAACDACAAKLDEFAAVDELVRATPAAAPQEYFETFPQRLRERLRASRPEKPAAWRVPVWGWAVAAALILAVLTPLTLRDAPLSWRERAATEPAAREAQAPAAAPVSPARAADDAFERAVPPEPGPASAGEAVARLEAESGLASSGDGAAEEARRQLVPPGASAALEQAKTRVAEALPASEEIQPPARPRAEGRLAASPPALLGAAEQVAVRSAAPQPAAPAAGRKDDARPAEADEDLRAQREEGAAVFGGALRDGGARATPAPGRAGAGAAGAAPPAAPVPQFAEPPAVQEGATPAAASPSAAPRASPAPAKTEAKAEAKAEERRARAAAAQERAPAARPTGDDESFADADRPARRSGALSKTLPADDEFTALHARSATLVTATAQEARTLRDDWRSFAARKPAGSRGDEARWQVIESGYRAWRVTRDPADRAALLNDARAYLARRGGAHAERVRAVLTEAERE